RFSLETIYDAKSAASAPEVHLMRELAPPSRVFCGLWGLVPGGGVEPPRPEGRRILSPLRLPVPPSRLRWQPFENSSLVHGMGFVICTFVGAHYGCSLPSSRSSGAAAGGTDAEIYFAVATWSCRKHCSM